MPILTYGCEVWGFDNLNIIEKLHLKYLKYILGVKMSTPTCMVLGETGRFPVNITIKTRMISFWSKLRVTVTSTQTISTQCHFDTGLDVSTHFLKMSILCFHPG